MHSCPFWKKQETQVHECKVRSVLEKGERSECVDVKSLGSGKETYIFVFSELEVETRKDVERCLHPRLSPRCICTSNGSFGGIWERHAIVGMLILAYHKGS